MMDDSLVPMMPDEFRGDLLKAGTGSCSSSLTVPRKWTDGEIAWVKRLLDDGFTGPQIARSVGRSEVSVHLKIKRLGKSSGSYNCAHALEKYQKNREFFSLVHPASVLDLYAGDSSFWATNFPGLSVTSNDRMPDARTDFHEKAERLCLRLLLEGRHFDLVDLDPFGSAYPCFDSCIQMADRAIVVTYGEMGHRRFRRFDFVSCHYGIRTMEAFNVESLVAETVRLGLCHKKRLVPVFVMNWHYVSRVYFLVEKMKVSGKWELK